MVEATGGARRDVDPAALEGELDGGVEDVADAAAVGRADVLDREAARDDFLIHREGAGNVAVVDVEEADLACEHGADADVGEHGEDRLDVGEA